MMSEVLLSVILTADEREESVETTLSSLHNQTLKAEVIEAFEGESVCEKRNRGLKKATGKYVCFPQVGDAFEPDFLEKLLYCMEPRKNGQRIPDALGKGVKKDADLGIVGYIVDEEENSPESNERVLSEEDMLCRLFYTEYDQGMVWNKVFRMDLIRGFHLGFREDISCEYDRLFLTEYLLHCDYVRMMPDHVYHHITGALENWEPSGLEAYAAMHKALRKYEDARWLCGQNMALQELSLFATIQNDLDAPKGAYKKSPLRKFARQAKKLDFVPYDEEDAALFKQMIFYGFTGKY